MLTIKLTPAQRSAVQIYITDPAHEEDYPEASLHGSILLFDCSYERAVDIVVDASNSADYGDGTKRDVGAVKSFEGVSKKLRELKPQ